MDRRACSRASPSNGFAPPAALSSPPQTWQQACVRSCAVGSFRLRLLAGSGSSSGAGGDVLRVHLVQLRELGHAFDQRGRLQLAEVVPGEADTLERISEVDQARDELVVDKVQDACLVSEVPILGNALQDLQASVR